MVCRVRLGKQRELRAAEDGKAAGSSRAAVGWQMLFCPAPPFAFITKTTESFILRVSVVCGPMQRLPTYVLSGWGKALTDEGIRHIFSLGEAPFLLCSSSCEVCPSSSLTAQADSLQGSSGLCGLCLQPLLPQRRNRSSLLQLPPGLP